MEFKITTSIRKLVKTTGHWFWKKNIYTTDNLQTIIDIEQSDIVCTEPFINDDLTISRNRSIITTKGNKEYVVNHSYKDLTKRTVIKGFYGNKNMARN